jgi:hypothetical protein
LFKKKYSLLSLLYGRKRFINDFAFSHFKSDIMKNKSLLKSTLCGLLLATAVGANVHAQNKKSNDKLDMKINSSIYYDSIREPIMDTVCYDNVLSSVGLSASSKFNPVLSFGVRLAGANRKSSDTLYMNPDHLILYFGMSGYVPITPFYESKGVFIDAAHNNTKYDLDLRFGAGVGLNLYCSYKDITFGGGILLLNKIIDGIPSLPNNVNTRAGYLGMFGMDVSHLFSHHANKVKDHLELQFTLAYIPKGSITYGWTSPGLIQTVDNMNTKLIVPSVGLKYLFKKEIFKKVKYYGR